MGVEGFEGVPLVACEPGRITASRLLLRAVWSPQSSLLSRARRAGKKNRTLGAILQRSCCWTADGQNTWKAGAWKMTGGDILWATRRGFWENLGRQGFPGSQGLESSGKVLTEATKVVETGSQGGVKGVKVLSLFYNLLLDVLWPLRNQWSIRANTGDDIGSHVGARNREGFVCIEGCVGINCRL